MLVVWRFPGLVHVKTIASLFIAHVHLCSARMRPCSAIYIVGNASSNISFTFHQSSGKRLLQFTQKCDDQSCEWNIVRVPSLLWMSMRRSWMVSHSLILVHFTQSLPTQSNFQRDLHQCFFKGFIVLRDRKGLSNISNSLFRYTRSSLYYHHQNTLKSCFAIISVFR